MSYGGTPTLMHLTLSNVEEQFDIHKSPIFRHFFQQSFPTAAVTKFVYC